MSAPTIYVIGGPNGAGKTTFAKEFLPETLVIEFLNADALSAGLSLIRPEAMGLRAGRLLLTRWKELCVSRKDFAFESTLSGKTYAKMLADVREQGYRINILYLWLPSVEMSVRRVRERVRKGGHSVPEVDLRRRYLTSVRNFFSLYLPLADEAVIYHAGFHPTRRVAAWSAGAVKVYEPKFYERIQDQIESKR